MHEDEFSFLFVLFCFSAEGQERARIMEMGEMGVNVLENLQQVTGEESSEEVQQHSEGRSGDNTAFSQDF